MKEGIHAHVLLNNYMLLRHANADWDTHHEKGMTVRQTIAAVLKDKKSWHRRVLVPMCVDVGFGRRVFVQPLADDSDERMSGYFVKLARELTGAGGKSQIPFDAPPHFRRLRASPGLLEPVHHGDNTGYLVCRPMSECDTPEG